MSSIAKHLLGVVTVFVLAIFSLECRAQTVPVATEDWNACLTYQAKYRENRDTIRRLGELVEREKHAASFCTGLYEAALVDLDRERNRAPVTTPGRSWLTFAALVASGAAAAAGGFIVSDLPIVGGVLIGAGATGIVLSGVFW